MHEGPRLDSCNVTAVCCVNISKVLIENHSLVYLSLSTNKLLDDGVKLLCEALGNPECSLERLSLESCGLTEAACRDLSQALISNNRLTHFCLAYNNVGDNGVKLLSDALEHPQCTLQSLVLRNCHLTPRGGEYLSTSLLHNKSLTHLDLASNGLMNDGTKLLCNVSCDLTSDLASAIVNCPNLWSLDLGNNRLENEGVKILCGALRHPDCNIQCLGLQNCDLTFGCCQDLSSSLLSNQRLLQLNLTKNIIGYEGIRDLCEVLRYPECSLFLFRLCKGKTDKESSKLLEAVGVSNPHLVIKSHYDYHPEEDGSWWQCF
uniref:NLR family, pyrin domain containing 14 n=1 Tax=Jaculus jaculus TaxID=51337 RepID=A0A8C5LGB5_JACJA